MSKRCAIYTRKSTDEGLSQSFNSLDAQREACASYVQSQRHEGWLLVNKSYDDGGYSGGSMARPALQNLLTDIRSRLIDVIVVYKIDRLTRSLIDFAKLVELFDATGTSFVSVTQQFNTSTSMGRLTLNVLLSFAQFEREVAAERIRDKIAASRKRGVWMGGSPPLGYDVSDKKLVINHDEAETVRRIFAAYLELGTTRQLTRWAAEQGIKTKLRFDAKGLTRSGGRFFSRGNLHALLANPTYVGEVRHKGKIYPGQHAAIIGRVLWDEVQQALIAKASLPRSSAYTHPSSLLRGIIFDVTGNPLTPTYTTKNGRRYRYYVSRSLIEGTQETSGWRLPARQLEEAVCLGIADLLNDRLRLVDKIKLDTCSADLIAHVLSRASEIAENIQQTSDPYTVVLPLLKRVTVREGEIVIDLVPSRLLIMLGMDASANCTPSSANPPVDAVHFTMPFILKRRGVEVKLVLETIKHSPTQKLDRDEHLLHTIARSYRWMQRLISGEASFKSLQPKKSLIQPTLPAFFPSPVSPLTSSRQSSKGTNVSISTSRA